MMLAVQVAGVDKPVRMGSILITRDSNGSMSTAKFTVMVDLAVEAPPSVGDSVLIVTGAGSIPAEGTGAWGEGAFGVGAFGGAAPSPSAAAVQFGGQIVRTEPRVRKGSLKSEYDCSCQDYTFLLDGAITSSESYLDKDDSFVIADLFSKYLPSISVAGISTIEHLDSVAFDGVTLKAAMTTIAKLTGAAWFVGADKRLYYYVPASVPAAFSLSDSPNNLTSFRYKKDPQFISEITALANKVTVFGAIGPGGVVVTYTAQDAASQTTYGVLARPVTDRQIQTLGEAQLRAEYELAQYAWPRVSGNLTFWTDGIDIGQAVPVVCVAAGINATYVVNRLSIKQISNTLTEYTADLGTYRADLAEILRRMDDQSKPTVATPISIPAIGTVTNDSLGASLGLVFIGNVLPTLPDPNYPVDCVFFLTTDRKVYRRDGNLWTCSVFNADLDRVTANRIVVTNADIESLAATKITAGSLDAAVINTGDLSANNIVSGTLRVGGGTGKPGLIEVYEGSAIPRLIGTVGNMGGGYYGGWFKTLYVGGSGPTDSPFKTDSSGRVSIDATDYTSAGALVRLNKGGSTVEILSDEWDAVPIALVVKNTATGIPKVGLGQGLIQIRGIYKEARLAHTVYGGVMELYTAAGALWFFADPETGETTSSSFDTWNSGGSYKVGGTEVIGSTRIADFVSLKIGGSEVVSASRVADFVSLKIGAGTVIDSTRNATVANLYFSGQFRVGTVTAESNAFEGLTSTQYIAVYDSGGSFVGKIPLI